MVQDNMVQLQNPEFVRSQLREANLVTGDSAIFRLGGGSYMAVVVERADQHGLDFQVVAVGDYAHCVEAVDLPGHRTFVVNLERLRE